MRSVKAVAGNDVASCRYSQDEGQRVRGSVQTFPNGGGPTEAESRRMPSTVERHRHVQGIGAAGSLWAQAQVAGIGPAGQDCGHRKLTVTGVFPRQAMVPAVGATRDGPDGREGLWVAGRVRRRWRRRPEQECRFRKRPPASSPMGREADSPIARCRMPDCRSSTAARKGAVLL